MKQLLSGSALALVLLLVGIHPASAQATVVRPDRKLTSDEVALRSAIYQLRDTLAMLSGSASRMGRDFQQTSGAALISRARQITVWCEASARNIPQAADEVRGHPMRNRLESDQQERLLGSYLQLNKALKECSSTFGAMSQPGKGEEIRNYGNARLETLQSAIKSYGRAADDFFSALRIPNRPLGAGANPFNNG